MSSQVFLSLTILFSLFIFGATSCTECLPPLGTDIDGLCYTCPGGCTSSDSSDSSDDSSSSTLAVAIAVPISGFSVGLLIFAFRSRILGFFRRSSGLGKRAKVSPNSPGESSQENTPPHTGGTPPHATTIEVKSPNDFITVENIEDGVGV